MADFVVSSRVRNLPLAGEDRAELGFKQWREAMADVEPDLAEFMTAAETDPESRHLLEVLFAHSPFLTRCAVADPAFVRDLWTEGVETVVETVLGDLDDAKRGAVATAELARRLRVAKRRISLAVAIADIGGLWPLEQVTDTLSRMADTALGCAAAHVLREAAAAGAFELADPDDPERDSGLVVLGMGKLGAFELNYSSDVDLIVLFDRERIRTNDQEGLQNRVVRMTRNLVKLLEERTVDGYVFRTDLRLRPDPGSTPLAISVLAAETYYETTGQNWERAALIKARPVAGDLAAGKAFLDHLQPFIWRKHLDFAAIQDIHSIKRQIDAHRGNVRIALPGHNVKLGRGGIREIEFFVQTQLLIWGGRQPEVRCPGTLDALWALVDQGHIAKDSADELEAAYRDLRRIEHRLQMINDEQTHSLPSEDEGLKSFAMFLGYEDTATMASEVESVLHRVEGHYAELFVDAPALSAGGEIRGNLVFTGSDPDPETFRTLENMGFRHSERVDAGVRGWHHGRYRAVRSARARELLTELMPALLQALARTGHPDDAFMRFDRFLSRLPSGVQLFSLFYSNPHLLDLMAEIIGTAERLADQLSHRPALFDSVLAEDFFEPLPSPADLDVDFDRVVAQATDFQDILDLSRRWTADRRFQVCMQCLRSTESPRATAEALSDLADTVVSRLLPRVHEIFAEKHGWFPSSGLAVLAMGKLGGREMTPASDLDLIFVYDIDPGSESSNGDSPLVPSQYYARLSQRFISGLTAMTAEGSLYEVDMRLRPSGKSGPIASSFDAFSVYQRESAWTWEHMALTRARVISAPPRLRDRLETAIRNVLTQPRDADALLHDVADMRARMDREHHSDFIWEAKHIRGGLVDIEFISQYLQLRHASDHPEILSTNTRQALEAVRLAGLLDHETATRLIDALDLWQAIQVMLRLTIEGRFTVEREAELTPKLRDTLARVGDAPDFSSLTAKLRDTAEAVYADFRALIEDPAAALVPAMADKDS